jgi:hypothetical protein
MTQRVIVADGCQQIDSTSGVRYYAKGARALEGNVRGGVFEMSDADAKAAVRMGGAIASLAGTASRATGWRCIACGFGSFLRICGRCGAECQREGVRDQPRP